MSQIASAVLDIGFARGVWADSTPQPMDNAFRQLREECQAQQALFDAQPIEARRLLDEQARKIAEALVQGQRQLSFALPEQVSIETPGRRRPRLARRSGGISQAERGGLAGSVARKGHSRGSPPTLEPA